MVRSPSTTIRIENRRHARAPIQLRVRYGQMGTLLENYTGNLSRGGAFIQTDYPLPVGTTLTIELSHPWQGSPLCLTGEVVWVESPASGNTPHGMGICFHYSNVQEKERAQHIIDRLFSEGLGNALYEIFGRTESPCPD